MTYRAVIFDLYQTLLYEQGTGAREKVIAEAQAAGITAEDWRRGWRATREDAMRGSIGSLRSRVRAALAISGHGSAPDALVDRLAGLLLGRHMPTLYQDTRSTLSELRARGYRLGLISNIESDWRHWVAELELDTLLDTVVHSCEVGMGKPDPSIYLLCAERLGVRPEECVFVDDQPIYLAGAKAVGMGTVYLDRPERWDPPEGQCESDARVEGLGELVEWLGR